MIIKPLVVAGVTMGIGLGGFVDGIVFHQLLQLHNMLTGRIPNDSIVNLETNMFWDGLFHAFTWIMTVVGLALLWRAGRRADVPWVGRIFVGGLVAGWGAFNLVEGIIDHHILHAHHVVERLGVSIFDYAFLASGVVLLGIGWMLIQQGRKHANIPSAIRVAHPVTP